MVTLRFYNDSSGAETLIETRDAREYWSGQYDLSVKRAGEAGEWVTVGTGKDILRRISLEHSVRTTSVVPSEELTSLEDTLKSATSIRAYIDGELRWTTPIKGFVGMKVERAGGIGWWLVTSTFIAGAVYRAGYLVNDDGDRLVDDASDPIVYVGRF